LTSSAVLGFKFELPALAGIPPSAYRLLELPMRAADVQRIETTLLKGWALGSPAFLANIGASAGRRPSPKPRGRPPLGQQPA
jgi:hypothetical protein